jgi:predicted HTH domain antitoxin
MKTLTLNVPDETNENEVKMTTASVLFDKGIFSSGEAAEFVGISKREFIENVGNYGVSIFGESVEDLRSTAFDK